MLKIKNTDTRVGAVYNYDIKILDWISLPAIIITPSNGTENYLDSCSYQSTINFTVRLIDRIQDWIQQIEDNMRVVADMIMTRLKDIWTISWTNDNWMTVKLEFDYIRWFADTQEPLRVFEVECKFVSIEN
jgi:hypothetical protein